MKIKYILYAAIAGCVVLAVCLFLLHNSSQANITAHIKTLQDLQIQLDKKNESHKFQEAAWKTEIENKEKENVELRENGEIKTKEIEKLRGKLKVYKAQNFKDVQECQGEYEGLLTSYNNACLKLNMKFEERDGFRLQLINNQTETNIHLKLQYQSCNKRIDNWIEKYKYLSEVRNLELKRYRRSSLKKKIIWFMVGAGLGFVGNQVLK